MQHMPCVTLKFFLHKTLHEICCEIENLSNTICFRNSLRSCGYTFNFMAWNWRVKTYVKSTYLEWNKDGSLFPLGHISNHDNKPNQIKLKLSYQSSWFVFEQFGIVYTIPLYLHTFSCFKKRPPTIGIIKLSETFTSFSFFIQWPYLFI